MRSNAVEHFVHEVQCVVDRFRQEYSMNYAELVGSLEFIKADLMQESHIDEDEEAEDDEDLPE